MPKIIGLGPFCSADPKCKKDEPCAYCLKIGTTEDEIREEFKFSPEEEKMIQEFIDKNRDLFDDLVKAGD